MTKNNLVHLKTWVARGSRTKHGKIMDVSILNFMSHYAEAERVSTGGEPMAGEIYHHFFHAGAETQRSFVTAICKKQGIEVPPQAKTPRQQLIHAVYGNDQSLVRIDKGERDSRGGKRITAALRKFEEKLGKRHRTSVRQSKADTKIPRSGKKFLDGLREVARPDELSVLEKLIARAYGRSALKLLQPAA